MHTFKEKKAETLTQYENELQIPKIMHKINSLVDESSPYDIHDNKN
jgi:hypothetical protein